MLGRVPLQTLELELAIIVIFYPRQYALAASASSFDLIIFAVE